MDSEAGRPAPHDPAARGFDGQTLSSVEPPAAGEAPSPAWLAQLGRAPIADETEGREVVRRLTEDGRAVPGDDPLYQYLGAQRVIRAEQQALEEERLARTRAVLDEARQGLAQLLGEVAAAGGAAVAARRAEDEAALKRSSAEFEERSAAAIRLFRDAMAEERKATTAAITVAVAEALAKATGEKRPAGAPEARTRAFWGLGRGWVVQGHPAALWAAVMGGSVVVGLLLLWVLKHH